MKQPIIKQQSPVELEDMQALLRFGHGRLVESSFMLLTVSDARHARAWLAAASITNAVKQETPPEQALQIAFTVHGLRALGLAEEVIGGFSDEFVTGMNDDESRSRRLGDVNINAPDNWEWGHSQERMPDLLLLLYASKGQMNSYKSSVVAEQFNSAFSVVQELPTSPLRAEEPFGFVDGISQPVIDWEQQQSTDLHDRDKYSNLLALGEVVLGYENEYGLYTPRPLLDPERFPQAENLPNAADEPALKDFGRNGSYLVLRQLDQDVPAFWKYVDQQSGSDSEQREQLAARMVGRYRDGTPLVNNSVHRIAGTDVNAANNLTIRDQKPFTLAG